MMDCAQTNKMKCLFCKSEAVKYKERHAPTNVFCGRLCQLGFHLIGLGTDDNIVGLEANDGTRIKLTVEQARQMKTIEYLLEDSGTSEYIPLPTINGNTLLLIGSFIQIGTIATKQLSDDAFLSLMMAANYLDFEGLLYHLMPEWVNKRPFPGPAELKNLIEPALYFYKGYFDDMDINGALKYKFEEYECRGEQWPIMMAAKNGLLPIVNRLLELRRFDANAEHDYPIRIAAKKGHLAVLERLLQEVDVDPTEKDNEAIRKAIEYGHLDVVKRLLKETAVDPSARNHEAFLIAVNKGYVEIVQLLLQDLRIDPNAFGPDAIHYAIMNGNLEMLEVLLQDTRVKIDDEETSAIEVAAEWGQLAILERLLQLSSANLGMALDKAVSSGELAIVNRLLQDPYVDPRDHDNIAIKMAAELGQLAILERFLQDPRVDPEVLRDYFSEYGVEELYNQYRRDKRQRFF